MVKNPKVGQKVYVMLTNNRGKLVPTRAEIYVVNPDSVAILDPFPSNNESVSYEVKEQIFTMRRALLKDEKSNFKRHREQLEAIIPHVEGLAEKFKKEADNLRKALQERIETQRKVIRFCKA